MISSYWLLIKMPQISKIAMFLAVVKHQSFAGAARELGFTGPALSKQVQALEDHLGVRLLHRTTRQVNLTEEGAIYYERARKALEDLDEAERPNWPMLHEYHQYHLSIYQKAKRFLEKQL